MVPHYHLKTSSNGIQFYFTLRAPNGERLLRSPRYLTRQRAKSGVDDCRANSSHDDRYQRLSAAAGTCSFRLLDAAGQIIAESDEYASMQERDAAIAACKRHGPIATTQDHTKL